MKVMLDTNICIYIINHKPLQVFEKFNQFDRGQVCISNISACELAFGVQKSQSERNKQALEKFLAPLQVLALDSDVIWHYARIRDNLQANGTPIGALDMLIAAHAMSINATLITNNIKEFQRITDLTLDNWV